MGDPTTHVTVRLGRRFAHEAGFSERRLALPEGATAASLLQALAREAPRISAVAGDSVDLAVANLSVNRRAVDPGHPEALALKDGDEAYLYGVISGG